VSGAPAIKRKKIGEAASLNSWSSAEPTSVSKMPLLLETLRKWKCSEILLLVLQWALLVLHALGENERDSGYARESAEGFDHDVSVEDGRKSEEIATTRAQHSENRQSSSGISL
jgi:hypothetical protein